MTDWKWNATGCGAEVGVYLEESGTLDTRLTAGVCDRLSEMERESWEDYRKRKHELRKEAFWGDSHLKSSLKMRLTS